ncbi:hypothetical protein Bca52824_063137 [Brassica carinata]|uniref:Uncharacterized protein n=1 Tax=Brassica carinata TaxID=52824 RepID=A0A8X7QE70_BRACI|nr:hypothetical protein Bca52824_063137 [Brassica carinata]
MNAWLVTCSNQGADIPILFLVLVVLPVVAYILLGKWSDISEKEEGLICWLRWQLKKIGLENQDQDCSFCGSVRADFVAELRPDSVAATCGVPINNQGHVCARCFNPAKTRCSRCKSIRYCSGKCQIIHWRLAHKDECIPAETCSSSSERVSFENDSVLHDNGMDSSTMYSNSIKQTAKERLQNLCRICKRRKSVGKPNSSKSSRESFSGEAAASAGGDSKKGHTRHKSRSNIGAVETNSRRHSVDNSCMQMNGQTFESGMQERIRATTLPKSGEQSCTETSKKGQVAAVSKTVRSKDTGMAEESNGISSSSNMGSNLMKMMGLRNSSKHDDRHKNLKMLFPYEEFVKFFQCEVLYSPRGLVNCGNSCYANAVLQSLTCTKPLVAYLLRRSHSRSCSGKDWCLMCELEQHVMMLRESGCPLSASRILSQMRSINCQIGDGSQEDAHEFLRLLVASMQSICLERLGGETKVDPRLQETTLVQHMFGGRLRSKVKCLRVSSRSLTQFTRPEDLDGENMYRCSRCAGYVRARKELSIHEAPNILTIVLKRFQEMFLHMLYAVIVHLDTLNASFSGHYISYVKDLRGNWFRIDDSEIHQVPMTQVMSEGAYMFYMRSYPRPQRGEHNSKPQARHPQPRNEMKEQETNEAASFTTESTRDSFSTVDYTDGCHVLDSSSSPFSIFNNLHHNVEPSPHNTVACRMFSGTKPETRYFVEEGEANHNNNTVVMDDTSSRGYYQQSMYVDYETNCQEQTYSYEQNW